MRRYALCLFFFLTASFTMINGIAEETVKRSQNTKIAFILPPELSPSILTVDEWKTPGLYSPVNLIDGDPATCHALTESNFRIKVIFEKAVYIDEIRVINGFARDKTIYLKNNRVRDFRIIFSNKTSGGQEYGILADKSEVQTIKLKKKYLAQEVEFTNSFYNDNINRMSDSVYKGSKYNDTCVSELEFFYKGEKVNITNIEEFKKDYINNIQKDLLTLLSERNYTLSLESGDSLRDDAIRIETNRDGSIRYITDMWTSKYFIDNIKKMPDRWKVENSMLYMRTNDKWILQKYKIKRDDDDIPIGLFIYTMPFESLSKEGYLKIY